MAITPTGYSDIDRVAMDEGDGCSCAIEPMASSPVEVAVTGVHQRRLAAILCADIVGYSRLMGEDEGATFEALRRLRRRIDPLIANNFGRIVSTAGDGLLAEFASVVEALACAVEMQRAASELNDGLASHRRLQFRIGVNLGDVIIADDKDIFGDGVNIAARLESLASPGGICLSQTVYEQVRNKLALDYRPLGRHRVKNIAEPVQVYAIGPAAPSAAAIIIARWRAPIIVGLGLLALFVPTCIWLVAHWPSPAAVATNTSVAPARLAGRTSVAVLPFKNLPDEAGQDSFADSLAEAVATTLGRFSTLYVVGGSATEPFKNGAMPPEQIARRLGVRYLVEGSVRHAGDGLRINARLVEAATARQLWSEFYGVGSKNVLGPPDATAQQIVAATASTMTRVEHDRVLRTPVGELAPHEYVLRARADYMARTREQNDEARELVNRAIVLDPNDAEAHSALGWTYYMAAVSGFAEFPKDDIERATALAKKAAGIDATVTSAYELLANIYLFKGEYDRAAAQADRAVGMNPNDWGSTSIRGTISLYAGKPAEAANWFETSLRLDPTNSPAALHLGLARYFLGQYEEAIAAFDRALARDPGRANQLTAHPVLAACYARLGRIQEAGRERAIVARLSPFFSIEGFAAQFGTQQAREDILAGLRGAGFR